MNIPGALREDLRALAKRHGTAAFVSAITELLGQLAQAGVAAEVERRRAGEIAEEQCPKCRRAKAVLRETKEHLRPRAARAEDHEQETHHGVAADPEERG